MNKHDFFENLPRYVEAALVEQGITDVSLERSTVTKRNDTVLNALMFKKDGSEICPTYYMEEFYRYFGEKGDLETAAKEMVRSYVMVGDPGFLNAKIELLPEILNENLGFRVLDMERNKDFLENVPYRVLCGSLVMIADVRTGRTEKDGEWWAVVTRELLEESSYTEDELFDLALETAAKNDPPVLTEIDGEMEGRPVNLFDLENADLPEDMIYVLSNASHRHGAGAIFYPHVAEMIAGRAGGFTVIPSSIHETILIPDSRNVPLFGLQLMLKDANETIVDRRDVLSDCLLHVDEEGRIFPIVYNDLDGVAVS